MEQMNHDFIKWDATSMQQLLRRKLSENGFYTDQIYPGSDIKVIMDIVSWTFNCLTYMLNNSAGESMFDSARVYEHMNKLVKILSYKPFGYSTSICKFSIDINNPNEQDLNDVLSIPRFASILVGGTDGYGKQLKYTFLDDYQFKVVDNEVVISNTFNWPTLYNGTMVKYDQTLLTSGSKNEQFIIEHSLDPNSTSTNSYPTLIVDDKIYVFLETIDKETGKSTYTELTRVDDIYFDGNAEEISYELRLNERKQYVIQFGDGVHGKLLPTDGKLTVIYLQSNGESGIVDSKSISGNTTLELAIENMSESDMLNTIYGGLTSFKNRFSDLFIVNDSFYYQTSLLSFTNIEDSSKPEPPETVDSIRQNAPASFTRGHRLIIADDFRDHILKRFKNEISDVVVMDNHEYTLTFLKWLHIYDCLNSSVKKENYKFSDACDFNNIYAWVKGRNINKLNTNQLQQIANECIKRKCATADVVPCNGLMVLLMPFVDSSSNPFDYNEIFNLDWNTKLEQLKIRIIKQQGIYVSDNNIKKDAANIIEEYFNPSNTHLGQLINLNEIYEKIMSIPGVKGVRTVNEFLGTEADGLSFACFTPQLLKGKDFTIFTSKKKLNSFQYPQLFQSKIFKYLTVSSSTD